MTSPLDRWPVVGRHGDVEAFEGALLGGSGGLVVTGAAGVGKTRLVEECCAAATRRGFPTAVAVASRTAGQLPLGALAHLIPPELTSGDSFDPVTLFARVRDDLDQRSGAHRLVLSVDDLHLLDVASATLISQLLAAGLVFLLGTVRDGEPVPDGVSALWRNGTVARIGLEPLTADDVATILHLALGGPVATSVTTRMWQTTEGNALFLRELVLEALGTGALTEAGGEWRADHLPSTSRRLVEVVADRIGALDDASRSVLDLLALCQPVGVADLEAQTSAQVLEDLERAGLIDVEMDRRRHLVKLAHPLYAEALRAAMPRLRQRRLLREQADRIEAHGARRRDDALHIASWRLDADGQADAALLVRGARVARHANDHRQTERLARAAHQSSPSPLAGLLLGEALFELGAFAEAEAVLEEIDRLADLTEDEVLHITLMRCKNLHWGHCDPAAAMRVNLAARPRVSPAGMPELIADEASICLFSGDPVRALELNRSLGDLDDPRHRVIRAISEAPALSLLGRTSEAIAVAESAFAEHLALTEPLALAHPGTHVISHVFALTDAGRFDDAAQLAMVGYDATADESAPIARVWFSLDLGRIDLLRGLPRSSRRWYAEGTEVARAHGFGGPLRLGLSGLACAVAVLGDAAAARAAIDERDALPPFAFLFADQIAGTAWEAQVGGRPAEARELLLAGAERAVATGHQVSASWLLHEAVRLGVTGLEPRLAAIAQQSDSALVEARAAHAAARATGSGEALAAMADTWDALGAKIDAAETAIAAADAYRRADDRRRAVAMDRRADDLVASCEGARTPGLARASVVEPLSPREREVALLAVDGLPSKVIGERLFLSVRTVNNHLQRAYTKLGVASRGELERALRR